MPNREPELYKDKIEVSLDGRQIFYLFFGGAAIVGLVFVLGVLVGRRIEARGHLEPAGGPTSRDPLAALDRLESSDDLSFQGALTGSEAPTDVEKAIGELEHRRAADTGDGTARDEAKPSAKTEGKLSAKTEGKPSAKTEGKPSAKTEGKPSAKAEGKVDNKSGAEGKVKFTLQLSSFQDRAEAEAFLATLKRAGYEPHLTEANASAGGRGTSYRVRLGSYRSLEAAQDAKVAYEKAVKKTAQIMQL